MQILFKKLKSLLLYEYGSNRYFIYLPKIVYTSPDEYKIAYTRNELFSSIEVDQLVKRPQSSFKSIETIEKIRLVKSLEECFIGKDWLLHCYLKFLIPASLAIKEYKPKFECGNFYFDRAVSVELDDDLERFSNSLNQDFFDYGLIQ